jgi:O-acetyl-ADP-ribose deacetylase (regulator of RNase III)
MEIILSAIHKPMLKAWRKYCGDLEGVVVHKGSILDLECDAIVSPANSFGFMDGGIDLLYSRRFGWRVQYRLQILIRRQHHGELLVGTAEIVETNDEKIPFLIAAPTMRVPMKLNIGANPYLAARAALLLVEHGQFQSGVDEGTPVRDRVKTVAFPGLGTGVGGVPPEVCARQVCAAIQNVVLGKPSFPQSWAEAQTRHQRMYTSDVRDLQHDDPRLTGLIKRADKLAQKWRRRRIYFRQRWK